MVDCDTGHCDIGDCVMGVVPMSPSRMSTEVVEGLWFIPGCLPCLICIREGTRGNSSTNKTLNAGRHGTSKPFV